MLEWVTEADFAKEFNLVQLADHPFMLDEDEETQILGQSKLLKLIKILAYKVGLSFKRTDIFKAEVLTEIK